MKNVPLKCLIGVGMTLAAFAPLVRADVVTLKNGDRITGTMITIRGGKLQLKSDVLGDLTIPLAQIQLFSGEKPVAVMVKGREPVQGQLQIESSGDWQVTAGGKSQTIAAASVDVIMPAETYQHLVEHTARPWQDWKGAGSLGLSIQRGDQQTSSFSTTVTAVRERPNTPVFERHWRTNYGLSALFAHASQDGTTVTSNTLSTNLRQDYLFSEDNFVFGVVDFDHVGAQGLYLRQTYGGGYGHDVIKSSRTLFSVLGGMTFVHEKFFTGANDQSGEGLLGENLGIKLTKWLQLDHNLNFYPNLTNTGEYRFDTAFSLAAKLHNRFTLNTGIIDLYLSNPSVGSRKNNVAFTTGLGYTF